MTTEIQTFITFDDIKALRFQCTCGTNVSVPINETTKARLTAMSCPNCPQQWFQGSHDQRIQALLKYMSSLLELQALTKTFQLGIKLEVVNEAFGPHASVANRRDDV